jgi:NTE family protein
MGAEVIIAVNLNSDIVGKHINPQERGDAGVPRDLFAQLLDKFNHSLKDSRLSQWLTGEEQQRKIPGMFEVMATSINIMQDRITKSRMAGDPPDVLLSPRLGSMGLLEFDRAAEAIAEGHDSVRRMLPAIQHALEST